MAKPPSSNKTAAVVKSSNKSTAGKKKRREVQVVTCPLDFPQVPRRSTSASAKPRDRKEQRNKKHEEMFLDWNDTAREVRMLGSQAFMGKEKREYRQEEYMRLTGRKQKQQRVPLPIQRGIKKKAAQRLERQLKEARQAGIILPVLAKKEKPVVNKNHGPAPSIGYMKKGVFRVKGANK